MTLTILFVIDTDDYKRGRLLHCDLFSAFAFCEAGKAVIYE